MNNELKKNNKILLAEKQILAGKLKGALTMKDNQIQIVYRDPDNPTDNVVIKTVYVDRYIPPESGVTVTVDGGDNVKVDYAPFGWTFSPNIGIAYNNEDIIPQLGFRFAYWGRWGVGVYTDFEDFGVDATYRIDKYVSWLKNSALSIGRDGKGWNVGFKVFL